jgi:predicted nucleic acid-binding Zn ribbon protein
MPRYEYLCECSTEPKSFTISLSFSEYQPVIPCPCGNGEAKRVFNSFNVQEGLTAKEKQFGTTVKRKQMTEFVKDQKTVRKTLTIQLQEKLNQTNIGPAKKVWTV